MKTRLLSIFHLLMRITKTEIDNDYIDFIPIKEIRKSGMFFQRNTINACLGVLVSLL